MFRIRMANAKLWKNLIGAISTLIDEGSFNADKDGMKLRAMDPSHVAMVDFEWPKAVFDEYVCDEPIKLCINFSEMLKFLKRIGNDESIDLNFDPKNAKLNIVLKSKYTRTFSMATLEPSSEEIPMPKVSFNSMARVTTDTLKNSMDDVSTVSDQIQFETSKDKISMKASGDLGTASIDIENGSGELLSLEVKQPSKATYSLNYILEMVKAASNLSDIVSVELSSDMPIRLNFEMPEKGKLQYYLAPRIENS
ncbi:MAG: proliferating cell nuclear antigen (pcna) [Candidatus Bathyarchaeota archaeon]